MKDEINTAGTILWSDEYMKALLDAALKPGTVIQIPDTVKTEQDFIDWVRSGNEKEK